MPSDTNCVSLTLPEVPGPHLGIQRMWVFAIANAVKLPAVPTTEVVRNARRGTRVSTGQRLDG